MPIMQQHRFKIILVCLAAFICAVSAVMICLEATADTAVDTAADTTPVAVADTTVDATADGTSDVEAAPADDTPVATVAEFAADTTTIYPVRDITRTINFGHKSERMKPDIIVVHSNYFVGDDPYDTDGCISQFRQYRVAAHYFIERDGTILKLVDENLIAYHAGRSQLPGTQRTSLNNCSIGIEINNTDTSGPAPEQYAALLQLVNDIRTRHNIRYLMRHSDVAPGRKTDPWCFDWPTFCQKVVETSGPLKYVK